MLKFKLKDWNIWYTSDTHYWHNNITKGISKWNNPERKCRDFNTVKEMSEHIVFQLNKYIKEDDILFHLGDWSFGGIQNIWNFRKQLNCKNIHLILGNHDHHIIKNKELPNVLYDFDEIKHIDGNSKEDGYIQYKYFYDYTNIVKARELFSSVQDYLEIEIDGKLICMSHYPMESWNDRHQTSYMLHGHCHGTLDKIIPKRLDVGIDNYYKLFGEYKPFEWKQIKEILK